MSFTFGCASSNKNSQQRVKKSSSFASLRRAPGSSLAATDSTVKDSIASVLQELTALKIAIDSTPDSALRSLDSIDVPTKSDTIRINNAIQKLSARGLLLDSSSHSHRFKKYARQFNADNSQKHIYALIVSGGGVKGSFAVGVLDGLKKKNPNFFKKYSIFAGTSTGSFIAPIARLGAFDALHDLYTNKDSLEKYYFSKGILPDIFRYDSAVYNTDGLKATLQGIVDNNYDRYFKPSADTTFDSTDPAILIATVSLQNGDLIFHCNKNPYPHSRREFRDHHGAGHGRKGIQQWQSDTEMVGAIMASACQPVFADLVTLTNGIDNGSSEQFADGGLRSYMPIEAALALGATDIDVIECSPLFFIDDGPYSRVLPILFRTLTLLTDQIGEYDIDYAEEMMDGLASQSEPLATTLRIFRPPYGKAPYMDDDGNVNFLYRYVDSHGKETGFPFAGSNLNFDADQMRVYYNKGVEIGSEDEQLLAKASQIFEKYSGRRR